MALVIGPALLTLCMKCMYACATFLYCCLDLICQSTVSAQRMQVDGEVTQGRPGTKMIIKILSVINS